MTRRHRACGARGVGGEPVQRGAEHQREAWELFQRGYALQKQGRLEEAVRAYQRSLDIYPTAEAYTFLGWALSHMGRLEEAIEYCRKAIALDPDYGNPYNDIGAYLIELGRLDEAIPWLEQALRAKRYDHYCFPWMNLGRIWERKGLWYRALECYKNALQCDPHYQPAARALARLRGLLN
ncbi:MAG: tetratricopeptide repeat protein [Dehalococcoidia bacterium]|nr:tetratricopeptide repeat protein [Dehalococcoidia bacterium]MDW8119360.1 tetratricopeptide repeat protein [Chloroflexota bacterium]